MTSLLEEISEVCIYLQKEGSISERVNEIVLYQPLTKKSLFDDTHQILKGRKNSFTKELPFSERFLIKIQTFFLQKIPILIKEERKTQEAKFKTVIAILLSQEALSDFFLNEKKQRENFFNILFQTANHLGYTDFSLPASDLNPKQIAHHLTTLSWQSVSLLENFKEFNLQLATLSRKDRDDILFNILNNIKRMPITSVIEVASYQGHISKIEMTTKYGKYKIKNIEPKTKKIDFESVENATKVSILTDNEENRLGTINQHMVYATTDQKMTNPFQLVGAISGHLKTHYHVLEQILFLTQLKGEVFLSNEKWTEDCKILFTSLFSWNEYGKIQDERKAIEYLDGKVLLSGERKIRLSLFYHNIPFNAFNKFPIPAEINASLNDLNDLSLISLSQLVLESLQIDFPPLQKLSKIKNDEKDFLKKQQFLLNEIDNFRLLQKKIISKLENLLISNPLDLSKRVLAISLKSLLLKKMPNGKPWHEIDHLIYLSLLANNLGILHNKNCEYATDRSAAALSIDKAQYAFTTILSKPYIPGLSTTAEKELFKVFYSMYLVFEEPELNAGLCTGFIGEKFYDNFIQKNPETTHYLIPWLKKHPETYLGLSHLRY